MTKHGRVIFMTKIFERCKYFSCNFFTFYECPYLHWSVVHVYIISVTENLAQTYGPMNHHWIKTVCPARLGHKNQPYGFI